MPAHATTHIATQESLDGTMADWLNKLKDEKYQQSVTTLLATSNVRSQHQSKAFYNRNRSLRGLQPNGLND